MFLHLSCRRQPARALADQQELQSEAEKFSQAVDVEDIDQIEIAPDSSDNDIQSKLQRQYADLQKQASHSTRDGLETINSSASERLLKMHR